jgi:hypothetical protein
LTLLKINSIGKRKASSSQIIKETDILLLPELKAILDEITQHNKVINHVIRDALLGLGGMFSYYVTFQGNDSGRLRKLPITVTFV